MTLRAIIELAKPRITSMVLFTTAGGIFLAPGTISKATIFYALFGVSLIVSGANALNMYLERDTDALMTRTQSRPLPTGRLSPSAALAFGIATGLVAVLILTFCVNALTGFLAALSYVMYVLWYTPLKQRSTTALLVGAVPGAMPPLLGWTAVTGHLDAAGIALFLILYLWQLPHFIAISMFSATDYARAGIKIIPVEHGIANAKHRIALYTLLLVLASLQAARVMPVGTVYAVSAVVLGAIFIALAFAGLSPRADNAWARRLFRYSLVYLPALFVAMVVGR